MLDALRGLFRPADPVARFEEVGRGVRIVEGVVRVEQPLRSPVRGQACAAFFYRSFLVITGGRQPAIHKLKTLEVYAPFDLQMEGGALAVEPVSPGDFGQTEHLDLMKRYGQGYHAEEDLILPGARVRVHGKVRRDGDRFVFRLKSVAILEKQAVPQGAATDRKRRRQKKG